MANLFFAGQGTPVADHFISGTAAATSADQTIHTLEDGLEQLGGTDVLILSMPIEDDLVRTGFGIIGAAKEAGVGHIIQISRYGAAHDAHWRMGREVGRVDLAVEESGIPFTILRASMLMGGIREHTEGTTVSMPFADAPVSYLHPLDLTDCVQAVMGDREAHAGRTYAVTGPQGLTQEQLVQTLGTETGQTYTAAPCDETALIDFLSERGASQWQQDMFVSLARITQRGMMGNVTGAVKHLTGNEPRTFAGYAQNFWE